MSRIGLLAAALLVWASAALAQAPERVVSINLCADALAIEIAAPGQLIALSRFARDPGYSPIAERARAYPITASTAEAAHRLEPDLILAGAFTTPQTLALLERLGHRVIALSPARTLEDVRANIAIVGEALGREARAAELIAEFDARLEAIAPPLRDRPRLALHFARSYSAGPDTLAGAIVDAAGWDNVAAELGATGHARIALERLVAVRPDGLIEADPRAGPALAHANLGHPALAPLRRRSAQLAPASPAWICGAPTMLEAIEELAEARPRRVAQR